jgi:predicted phage-related endonuclease
VTDTHIDLPADLAGWIDVLHQVKAKREELDQVETAAREKIQAALGDTEEGHLDGRPVVRWTHTAPARRFDTKRFKTEHPRLHDLYVTAGEPGRRFTLVTPDDEQEAGQ